MIIDEVIEGRRIKIIIHDNMSNVALIEGKLCRVDFKDNSCGKCLFRNEDINDLSICSLPSFQVAARRGYNYYKVCQYLSNFIFQRHEIDALISFKSLDDTDLLSLFISRYLIKVG